MEISKGKRILLFSTLIVVGLYFFFLALVKASGFLAPLLTAIILALMVLPLSRKMESRGLGKGTASFLNVLFLFLVSLGFMAVISFQIQGFIDDWPKIKETMRPKIEQFKSFVFEHTPMEESDLQGSGFEKETSKSPSGSEGTSKQSGTNAGTSSGLSADSQSSGSESTASSGGSASGQAETALTFLNKVVGFIGTFLLTFIYIFFLLNYRRRFKEFLFRLLPEKKEKVNEVIQKSANVSQQYLVGKLILMGFLAVLYAIGLGISGVNNFILVSIIAALLTLIPYIGNMIGIVMALAFGYLTSGETGVLIGILITFAVAQFVESYVLEPYVVGDKVDLHPFFVILAVVGGGALWGVIGMILAIPVLAIIAIIFLHVRPLHPFGFLLSNEE